MALRGLFQMIVGLLYLPLLLYCPDP
jgi:hypothetical protein